MRKVEWVIVKSYYKNRRFIRRELYGHSDKLKNCTQMLRGYKSIVLNKQEPFLKDAERVTGHYNRAGLDVRGDNDKLIEFRIHSVNIFLL